MIPPENLKRLKQQAHAISPTLQIGKSGLTPALVDELAHQLKKKKIIKIKMLAAAFAEHPSKKERQAFAVALAEKFDAEIVQQVGFVLVLYKA